MAWMSRITVRFATVVTFVWVAARPVAAAASLRARMGRKEPLPSKFISDTIVNIEPNLQNEEGVSEDAWKNARSVPYLNLHGHHRNFFFCMIPKNACSEFLSLAMRMDGMSEEHWNLPAQGRQQLFVHFDEEREYLFVRSQEEFNDALNGNTVSAVFLRDPVTRLLSAYRSKVMEGYFERSKGWSRTMAFEDFVKHLAVEFQTDPLQDPHLRPQSYLCGLNQTLELYDFIGDFDKLDEDSHKMVGQIGGEEFAAKMLDQGWGADSDQALFGVSREEREGNLGMSSTNSEKDKSMMMRIRSSSMSKFMWHSYEAEKEYIQAKLDELRDNPELEAFIKDMYQIDYALIERARVHMASK